MRGTSYFKPRRYRLLASLRLSAQEGVAEHLEHTRIGLAAGAAERINRRADRATTRSRASGVRSEKREGIANPGKRLYRGAGHRIDEAVFVAETFRKRPKYMMAPVLCRIRKPSAFAWNPPSPTSVAIGRSS